MDFVVICVSDRCSKGQAEDQSGFIIRQLLSPLGSLAEYLILPDEKEEIEKALMYFSDEMKVQLVVTTGGTGFAPRDVTPEATANVIEKDVPGIAEAIRFFSLSKTPNAMLSRAKSGIRKGTLIINLPGSPKAVKESMEYIIPVLPHALETLSGNTQNCGGDYGKGVLS